MLCSYVEKLCKNIFHSHDKNELQNKQSEKPFTRSRTNSIFGTGSTTEEHKVKKVKRKQTGWVKTKPEIYDDTESPIVNDWTGKDTHVYSVHSTGKPKHRFQPSLKYVVFIPTKKTEKLQESKELSASEKTKIENSSPQHSLSERPRSESDDPSYPRNKEPPASDKTKTENSSSQLSLSESSRSESDEPIYPQDRNRAGRDGVRRDSDVSEPRARAQPPSRPGKWPFCFGKRARAST